MAPLYEPFGNRCPPMSFGEKAKDKLLDYYICQISIMIKLKINYINTFINNYLHFKFTASNSRIEAHSSQILYVFEEIFLICRKLNCFVLLYHN